MLHTWGHDCLSMVLVLLPCQVGCAPSGTLQHLFWDWFLGFDSGRFRPVLIVSSLVIDPVSGLLWSLPASQPNAGSRVSLWTIYSGLLLCSSSAGGNRLIKLSVPEQREAVAWFSNAGSWEMISFPSSWGLLFLLHPGQSPNPDYWLWL